jgi:hypothetical protein
VFKGYGNYDKYPEKKIDGFVAVQGYDDIRRILEDRAAEK